MSITTSYESYDSMLPGPPSRNNGGSSDCSTTGLFAYGTGSSVAIVDTRSSQLITVLPMPAPSSSPLSLSPFITSVRFTPQHLQRNILTHELSNLHLRIAAGDRQGRIAIWDIRSRNVVQWLYSDQIQSSKLGVQDLCWIQARSLLLASINGSSMFTIWNTVTGRCIYKYDASPEFLSCIRRDPFDSRHVCVLGFKGFFLSVKALGDDDENDIVIKEKSILTISDSIETQKIDKENSQNLPALAVFPALFAKFCFSPLWKNIVFVTFPREFIVFDLQYESVLFSTPTPRGSGKFMDVVANPDLNLIYCTHLDGRLSVWKRKEGEQAYVLFRIEELLPSIGTTVPTPAILSVSMCLSEATLRNLTKIHSDFYESYSLSNQQTLLDRRRQKCVSEVHLISISDDGKIWNWLLTSEEAEVSKHESNLDKVGDVGEDAQKRESDSFTLETTSGETKVEPMHSGGNHPPSSTIIKSDLSYKISLVGQLQLLSSTVTMLAVPSPSLTATLARGGNNPAVAVPLVALGTQNGTIDIIDISANAVAASFSVHNGVIRGLRWLGNSRLASFSYTQINDKAGGYTNRLVVTCLRSGLNRTFRILQKPERAPIRALRASSSGRYLLILFRDAPVEVWAMTKTPIMLRSLALPFTVLEWTLPAAPKPNQNVPTNDSSLSSKKNAATVLEPSKISEPIDAKGLISEGSIEDLSESFAFALVNGSLGVFEIHGRRIRDFRPKWPSSSFVSSEGLVTAMAYRLPHVVMGDRTGNIRWWDVTTGASSSFNTHREGIRRIKFSPVVSGDRSRGRIAVLFYDNTFSIFDLDTQDPLANALLQPQLPGTLVLELDWLPLRTERNEPLVLCIAGADSSFRLIEVNINDAKSNAISKVYHSKERFRPVPVCAPILLPTPHALALRMILQLGVKPSWFKANGIPSDEFLQNVPALDPPSPGDFRSYMINTILPPVGDSVVPELLIKVLEPYRKDGCMLDDEMAKFYARIVTKSASLRFAFAAAVFGEISEALFWLQLPRALSQLISKSVQKSPLKANTSESSSAHEGPTLDRIMSMSKSASQERKNDRNDYGQFRLMAFDQEDIWRSANERVPWHENLDGEDAIQKRVHELVSVGNLEAAVSLLLSTPPEGAYFYVNALRAIALSSAVSRSLHELAVKVVAANVVRTDKSLSGTHLLCAVGRYQEACSQLQDAGCWTDAATLAAAHLHGTDYSRVLQRWADHLLNNEHNLWRALVLYVAAGALPEALAALRDMQQPDTAAMFLLACHEVYTQILSGSENSNRASEISLEPSHGFLLPFMNADQENVAAVSEHFGQYQRKLIHLCMDATPVFD